MSVSEKAINAVFKFGLIIMLIIIMTVSQKLSAQDKEWESPRVIYSGIEASFGIKVAEFKSTITELNGLTLITEGGNAGAVFGTSFSRVVVRPLGFYSAVGSIGRTINTYSLEVENNTYLLKGILKRPTKFDVYSLIGLNFNSTKFFGHYIDEDFRPSYKNKAGKEPYLGKMESLLITAGIGAEYALVSDHNFVHIFFAGKYHMPMQLMTDSGVFEDTSIEKSFDLSLGLRFGLVKTKRNQFLQL